MGRFGGFGRFACRWPRAVVALGWRQRVGGRVADSASSAGVGQPGGRGSCHHACLRVGLLLVMLKWVRLENDINVRWKKSDLA